MKLRHPQRCFLHRGGAQQRSRDALTARAGTWKPISAASCKLRYMPPRANCRHWGIRQGRPRRHPQREPPGVGDRRLCRLLLGAVDVPIYATQTAEQCLYMLQNSEARMLFVSTRKQYEKIAAIRDQPSWNASSSWMTAPELHDAVPMRRCFTMPSPARRSGAREHRVAVIRARRSGDADLHLRHHGHAQGRDADARQHRVEPEHVSLDMYECRSRTTCASRSCRCRTSPRGTWITLLFYRGVPLAYCPVIDDLPAGHARSASHTVCRPCRACTRSLQPGAAQGARREAQAHPLGAVGWAQAIAKRSSRRDPDVALLEAGRTRWCFPSVAKDWAAGAHLRFRRRAAGQRDRAPGTPTSAFAFTKATG